MGLERLNDNDFIDVDKVSHFFIENNKLIVVIGFESIEVPDSVRKDILVALWRNDYSKKRSKQYTSV